MAKKNFLTGFARSFRPGQAANIVLYSLLRSEREKERSDRNAQAEEDERLRAEEENQKAQGKSYNALQSLVLGGKTGTRQVEGVEETPDVTQNLFGQRDKTALEKFGNQYQPKTDYQETFRPYTLLEEVVLRGQVDPKLLKIYDKVIEKRQPKEKKKLATTTGYNKKGEKEIFIKYDDGSGLTIPTGFYKDKGKDKYDPVKFNKTLDSFVDEQIKINNMKSQYGISLGSKKESLKANINLLNETNEALIKSVIQENPKLNEAINTVFDELKSTFGEKKYREFEKTKQEEIRQKIINEFKQKAIDGDLSIEEFRALKIWADFKYGYVK